MIVNQYNLPDLSVLNSEKPYDYLVWQPDKIYIILGRSNSSENSVFEEKAVEDNIEILKRPSGGESVILTPKTLVISVKISINDSLKAHQYFKIINDIIIKSLTQIGVKNLCSKGISDISIGEKKILGSSIYRQPDRIFYHAVLNISEDVNLIQKYLKYPQKEPDYRKGRKHTDFVTSILTENKNIESLNVFEVLNENLKIADF